MELKAVMDSIAELPEVIQQLYTERHGKFELTGIEGIKTQNDVERVQESLRKEREDHRKTKFKLMPESGIADGSKIQEMAKARIKEAIGPYRSELENLLGQFEATESENASLDEVDRKLTVREQVKEAAKKGGIIHNALDDVLLNAEQVFQLGEDGNAITEEGRTPTSWLNWMRHQRPFWWPESIGGGARETSQRGIIGNNPWKKEHWNLTAQGDYLRTHGQEKAERAARAAGSHIGATEPK